MNGVLLWRLAKKFYYGLNGPENQTENVERKKGQTASDVGGGPSSRPLLPLSPQSPPFYNKFENKNQGG